VLDRHAISAGARTGNEPPHKIYELTGCLESGTTATVFKLTGSSAIGTAPPLATPRAGVTSATNNVYELQAVSSIGQQAVNREELQSHVARRVQVTVRPVEPLLSSPSSTATETNATTPEQQSPQRYSVVKITRLAESCP
jgi:hypothetical protein